MIRKGKWKYVYYVGYPAQLFNLENDPHEANDLAGNKDFQPVLDRYEAMLREMVDPEEVNRSAFEDQKETLQLYGGVDAVVKRGYFGEHSLERNLYEEETDEKYFKYINAP